MVSRRVKVLTAAIAACLAATGLSSGAFAGASAYDLNVFLNQPHPFAGTPPALPEVGTPLYRSQIRAPARFPQSSPSSAATVRSAAQPTFLDRSSIAQMPGSAPARPRNDDPGFITLGAGYYDINDNEDAVEARLEWRGGTKYLWIFKPLLGVMGSSEKAVYGYAGFLTDFYFGRRIVVSPSVAPGYYHNGGGKDLGHEFEIKSGLEIAYRLDDRSRIGLHFYHLSNAGLEDTRPGVEVLGTSYSIPLN